MTYTKFNQFDYDTRIIPHDMIPEGQGILMKRQKVVYMNPMDYMRYMAHSGYYMEALEYLRTRIHKKIDSFPWPNA
jgi:hypothetical protein